MYTEHCVLETHNESGGLPDTPGCYLNVGDSNVLGLAKWK